MALSQNDLLLAILVEFRILNQQMAEANSRVDELQQLRLDHTLTFPLLNTAAIPTS